MSPRDVSAMFRGVGRAVCVGLAALIVARVWAPSLAWVVLLATNAFVLAALVLRATGPWLAQVVTMSYLGRAVLTLALYAISLWGLPVLSSVQFGRGFWMIAPDGVGYHEHALMVLDAWREHRDLSLIFLGQTAGLPWYSNVALPLALFYRVLGPDPLNAMLMNAVLGAAAAVPAYRLASRLGGPQAGRQAALLVSLWPSGILWSTQLLKDPLTLLAILALFDAFDVAWQHARVGSRAWWGAIAVFVLALGLTTYFRIYVGYIMLAGFGGVLAWAAVRRCRRHGLGAVALPLSLVACMAAIVFTVPAIDFIRLSSHPAKPQPTVAAPVIAEAAPALTPADGMSPSSALVETERVAVPSAPSPASSWSPVSGAAVSDRATESSALVETEQVAVPSAPSPASSWSPVSGAAVSDRATEFMDRLSFGRLDWYRQGMINSGGYSVMDPQVRVDTGLRALWYLPRAAAIALFSPFPWQWFDTQGQTGLFRLWAACETIMMFALLPVFIWACARLWRHHGETGRVLVVFSVVTALTIAYTVANLGILFRLRLQYVFPLLVAAGAMGIETGYAQVAAWVRETLAPPSRRRFAYAAAVCAGVCALIYWRYPFNGMILEESWSLYAGGAAPPSAGDPFAPLAVVPWERRGLSQLLRLAMAHLQVTPVQVNLVCIAAQAVNLMLFAAILLRVASPAAFWPAFVTALLYPFASGARFWQIAIVHHAAIGLVLLSVLCALRARAAARDGSVWRWGAASLAAYAASLWTMEHAVLFVAVFAMLWQGEKRPAGRWLTVAAGAIAAMAVVLFLGHGHPRLAETMTQAVLLDQLHAAVPLPRAVLSAMLHGANAVLFACSAVAANTAGLVLHPLATFLSDGGRSFSEDGTRVAAALGLAALLGWLLSGGRLRGEPEAREGWDRRLFMFGTLWAIAAYLPYGMSFAYPGVVGQVADRVNMLALFGVALAMGAMVPAGVAWLRARGMGGPVVHAAGMAVVMLLLMHIFVQRAWWVAAWQRERLVAQDLLRLRAGAEARMPVVLLAREHDPASLREQAAVILQDPAPVRRMWRLGWLVLSRHFTEAGEMEATAFHLKGIPLFGGVPEGAQWVFDNYARVAGQAPVPVYKQERGFAIAQRGGRYVVEYDGRTRGTYPEGAYAPLTVTVTESFFDWDGRKTEDAGRWLQVSQAP